MQLNRQTAGFRQAVTAGFTLVEALCAIVISTIMVSVLFATFNGGYAILRVTQDDLRATQILMQKTESFRLFTWQQLTNAPTSLQEYYNPSGATNGSGGTIYYETINAIGDATNIPNSASYKTNIHLITITICWTNDFAGKSVGHSRQVQTLNAVNGMQGYLFGS